MDGANFVVTRLDDRRHDDSLRPRLAPAGSGRRDTPVVSAPSTDAAPVISVFGPELLKLSARPTRQIRLIVQSSGERHAPGEPRLVSLGSSTCGRGTNDVRFTLPPSAVSALRRSAAASSNVLTLTPLSTSGAAGARR